MNKYEGKFNNINLFNLQKDNINTFLIYVINKIPDIIYKYYDISRISN